MNYIDIVLKQYEYLTNKNIDAVISLYSEDLIVAEYPIFKEYFKNRVSLKNHLITSFSDTDYEESYEISEIKAIDNFVFVKEKKIVKEKFLNTLCIYKFNNSNQIEHLMMTDL